MSKEVEFLPGHGVPGLVSVIIPTYQRGAIIAETIDSLLAQSYEQFEAIVVDDGSTDDTPAVMTRYTDPRIRYIRKEHGGLSATRNVGFEHARGEFIAFLDSDDLWLPWKLKAQIALFERRPDVGMIWSDMSTFVTIGDIVHERHLRTYYAAYQHHDIEELCNRIGSLAELSPEVPAQYTDCGYYVGTIFPEMFFGNLVHPPTAIVRRSRLQQSGGFEVAVTGHGADDFHFYLRVTEKGPVAFIDAPTIHYRVHAQQMSTVYSLAEAHSNLRLVEHWAPRVEHLVPKHRIDDRRAGTLAWAGSEELSAGNAAVARRYLWRSLKLRPTYHTAMQLATALIPGQQALRVAKRRVATIIGIDKLVRIALFGSGTLYVLYRLLLASQRIRLAR